MCVPLTDHLPVGVSVLRVLGQELDLDLRGCGGRCCRGPARGEQSLVRSAQVGACAVTRTTRHTTHDTRLAERRQRTNERRTRQFGPPFSSSSAASFSRDSCPTALACICTERSVCHVSTHAHTHTHTTAHAHTHGERASARDAYLAEKAGRKEAEGPKGETEAEMVEASGLASMMRVRNHSALRKMS